MKMHPAQVEAKGRIGQKYVRLRHSDSQITRRCKQVVCLARSGFIVTLASAGLVAGCATQSVTLDGKAVPQPETAYVFGNFHIQGAPGPFGMSGRTIVLLLQCDDGRGYNLRFSADKDVVAYPVKPARCAISQTRFLGTGGFVESRVDWPEESAKPIQLVAGQAYYLGSVRAQVSHSDSATSNWISTRWRIDEWKQRFSEASNQFRVKFPALEGVKLTDVSAAYAESLYSPGK